MNLTCKVDISGLQAAINERVKYPGRTEADVVNRTAFWVAYNTMNDMPFTSIGKIDTELGVAVNLKVGKRGKFLRNKRNLSYSAGKGGDVVKDIPLAALIIQARANPNSRYNQLTNSRYAGPSPFKGKSREAGRAAMAAAISRMIKRRHSSIKFLLAGWVTAVTGLWQYKGNKAAPLNGVARRTSDFGNFGSVTVAQEGGSRVYAVIENRIGLEGVNGVNFNQAMLKYGVPALQRAIDREEVQMLKYMIEKTKKQNEKFNAMCR